MKTVAHLDEAALARLRERLQDFPPKIRARGEDYFSRGRVRGVQSPAPQVITATVSGTERYTVTWHYAGGGWHEVCSCPMGGECKHAFALALTVLRRCADDDRACDPRDTPPRNPPPADANRENYSNQLTRQVVAANGRALTADEQRLVRALTQLWNNHRQGSPIRGEELYALHGHMNVLRGEYAHISPFHGCWEQYPASPLELWQFIAWFFDKKKVPAPAFLAALTDLPAVTAKIEAHRQRLELARWRQVFEQALPPPPGKKTAAVRPREARLVFEHYRFRWQYRADGGRSWHGAKAATVREWLALTPAELSRCAPSLSALVQALWAASFSADQAYRRHSPSGLELQSPLTVRWLAQIPDNPALAALVLGGNGQPLNPEPVCLHWRGAPAAGDKVHFALAQPDGEPLPANTLPLTDTLRFDSHAGIFYRLPPALVADSNPARGHLIPRAALASGLGQSVLRRLGARLEGVTLPGARVIAPRPRFVCRHRFGVGDPNGRLEVELFADADGQPLRRHTNSGWRDERELSDSELSDLDMDATAAAVNLLAELNLRWDDPYSERSCYVASVARNFPERFAKWVEDARAAGADVQCDPLLAAFLRAPDRARLGVTLAPAADAGVDWFDLNLIVSAEDTAFSAEETNLLLQARGRFVFLKGKGWRRLQLDLADGQREQLDELGLNPDLAAGKPRRQRFHTLQLAGENLSALLPARQAEELRERARRLRAVPPPPLPASLSAVPRPYQLDGYHFLAHLAANNLGGVLADDMGLGKTLQTLIWLLHLAEQRAAGGLPPPRALVVCPKSVVSNWQLEAARFTPALTVGGWPAAGALPDVALTVINYAQLRRRADALARPAWDAVILDEGQNIKNPQSQGARAACALRAARRLVLTGTPVENRALDLWSLFAFAMPGLLGGQAAFQREFGDRADPLASRRLARRVSHFMLRRAKAQVAADLPPRVEESLLVELEGAQRKLYDAELKRARRLLLNISDAAEFNAQRFNILQSLLRLRQICCHPALVGNDLAAAGSAKVAALFDQLEPILAEGHKVLVFSQFVTMLEILQRELADRRIAHLMLTGRTQRRQELVERFQTRPDEQVFLLSLKAAGTGLNLTAASYVVLFDPWWNPAVEAQAIDRTHRIGQSSQVIAYRLLAKNTVEEKIRQLQEHKAALAKAIVREEPLTAILDLDDLRQILA
ncbi:MAG: DEAD/DEAH box helicase [Verrucomicrobiales bacterium]|nr:DEAD/DEAH box helicase [Verrucomicrobiales bacterium]